MLAHVLGLDNASGPWYLFWSGIAGDLVYLGALGAALRRANCHEHGCWRMGRHPVDGYRTCRRHHPQGGFNG